MKDLFAPCWNPGRVSCFCLLTVTLWVSLRMWCIECDAEPSPGCGDNHTFCLVRRLVRVEAGQLEILLAEQAELVRSVGRRAAQRQDLRTLRDLQDRLSQHCAELRREMDELDDEALAEDHDNDVKPILVQEAPCEAPVGQHDVDAKSIIVEGVDVDGQVGVQEDVTQTEVGAHAVGQKDVGGQSVAYEEDRDEKPGVSDVEEADDVGEGSSVKRRSEAKEAGVLLPSTTTVSMDGLKCEVGVEF